MEMAREEGIDISQKERGRGLAGGETAVVARPSANLMCS